jgi:hypothetical protein
LAAETSNAQTPEAWLKEEVERYEKQGCEGEGEGEGEEKAAWERVATIKPFFENARYITLSFEFVAFEGGAHENRQRQFATWDKETQTPLRLATLFPETERLLEVAEAEFRKARKLKPEDAFEENGYWFERGQFRLSEQLALSECGLLLHYNPYEVAAYAVGSMEVVIPPARLKGLSNLPLFSKPLLKAFGSCPNAPPSKPSPKRAAPRGKNT